MPGGKRVVAEYLNDRYQDRAMVAMFWRKIPQDLLFLPEQELRRMREFAIRTREAEREAIEAAKMGVPTPGKGPKPGDTVVGGKDDF